MGYYVNADGFITLKEGKYDKEMLLAVRNKLNKAFDEYDCGSNDDIPYYSFGLCGNYYADEVCKTLDDVADMVGNYITDGEVQFSGEDREYWRFVFKNGMWIEEPGHVVYNEDDLATQSDVVIEVCPHCSNEVEMRWNTKVSGLRAFCPFCGNRLMLCSECDGMIVGCDYDSDSDTCKFSRPTY